MSEKVVVVVSREGEDWGKLKKGRKFVAWKIGDDVAKICTNGGTPAVAIDRGANCVFCCEWDSSLDGLDNLLVAWHSSEYPMNWANVTPFTHSSAASDSVWTLLESIVESLCSETEFPLEKWSNLHLVLDKVEQKVREAALEALEVQWSKVLGVDGARSASEFQETIESRCTQAGIEFPDQLADLFQCEPSSNDDVIALRDALFGDDEGMEPGLLEQVHLKIHDEDSNYE